MNEFYFYKTKCFEYKEYFGSCIKDLFILNKYMYIKFKFKVKANDLYYRNRIYKK